jgi:two-component sensor histidine kinase
MLASASYALLILDVLWQIISAFTPAQSVGKPTSPRLGTVVTLVFLLLALPMRLMAAEPLQLWPEMVRFPLGTHLDILEDAAKQWTIQDIVSEPVARLFVPSHSPVPAFGFTLSAYWARFSVANPLDQDVQWWLEIAYPPMDHIALYTPTVSGQFDVRKTGDLLPFHTREVKERHFIFQLLLPPKSQQTYYLRFETAGVMNLPLTILSSSALIEKSHREEILLGLYYGAIVVMLIYNLFIFLSIRDTSYLYYVLFNCGWVLAMLTLNGLAFQYLWPRWVWWTNNSLLFFFCFSFLWGVQFTRAFLETTQHTPRFDIILRGLMLLSGLGVAASLFASYHFAVRLTTVIGMFSLLIWISGFLCLLQGVRTARYYMCAWSALILGVAVLSLKNCGILPHTAWTVWAPQVGSATEIILLSLGLADRIKTLRGQKEQAEKVLMETRITMQDALLKEVHHRVKNNLQVISSLLSLQSGYATDQHVLEMFKESQHRVESMAFIHEQLYRADDSRRIDVADYTHTLATHLFVSYGARAEPISLALDIDNVTLSIDTAVPCGLIIHELVTNALKHAFPDGRKGEIRLSMVVTNAGQYTLVVSDNGIGFPTDLDFRHTESLGLQLVTTLTEQLDGTIALESNGGTTFRLAFAELHYEERD